MGKIALWIVVIIVVMLLVRALKPRRGADADGADKGAARGAATGGGSGSDRAAQGDGPRGELMMSCAVCGVHLPASDAIFARGRVYCGPEHRDVDLDVQPRDRDAAARGDGE